MYMNNDVLLILYPKCNTCKRAKKWLIVNNIEFETRDITIDNPTAEELTKWIPLSGLPVRKFFNVSGNIYKNENIKERVKSDTDSQLIELLSQRGMLVKRPLLVTKDFVLVGFKEDQWKEKLL